MHKEEWFPLVDEAGLQVGKALRQECHNGSMLLHPVVHLHIFNSAGELYLQKRSANKDIQPGKWDTAVGGHINLDETVQEALSREASEELGMDAFIPVFISSYIFESDIEKELVYTYYTNYNGMLTPDKEELETGKFWTFRDINNHLDKGIFTPNFVYEFRKVILPILLSKQT